MALTEKEEQHRQHLNDQWDIKVEMKKTNKEIIDLVRTETLKTRRIRLANGSTISLDGNDYAMLNFYRSLDAVSKLKLLLVTEKEAMDFYKKCYEVKREKVKNYLNSKIWFRDTGDICNLNDKCLNETLFGISASKRGMLSLLVKGKLTNEDLDRIISAFESDGREIITNLE